MDQKEEKGRRWLKSAIKIGASSGSTYRRYLEISFTNSVLSTRWKMVGVGSAVENKTRDGISNFMANLGR